MAFACKLFNECIIKNLFNRKSVKLDTTIKLQGNIFSKVLKLEKSC